MALSPSDSNSTTRVFSVDRKPDFVEDSDVFAMARSSFGWLVTDPDPITVDSNEIAGLPSRPLPLDELGTVLLAPECPQETRDAAWTYLVTRARQRGGQWTVACVGLALPVLLPIAAKLTCRFAGEKHDVHAAVLTGFLEALRVVDLGRPAILVRLRWAAYRAGHAALRDALSSPVPTLEAGHDAELSARPSGHPDLVLARAVRAGVLTAAEAELIAATRLGELSLAEAAAVQGRSYKATQKARERAEARLVAYLADHGTTPAPAASRRRPALQRHATQHSSGRAAPDSREQAPGAGRTKTDQEPTVRRGMSPRTEHSGVESRGPRLPADRQLRTSRTALGSDTPSQEVP